MKRCIAWEFSIKAHGGNIKAENLKTGGALFRFALDTEEISDEAE